MPVKGSLARDPYVCSAGQQFPFSLEDGAETIRGTMLRSVGINGGGFDARSTVDNMVYQASRLPQPFDASAMPMTHSALQHIRAGLGVVVPKVPVTLNPSIPLHAQTTPWLSETARVRWA